MKQYLKHAVVLIMAVAGICVATTSSFAHHLWVQKVDGVYAVCRGTINERLDSYNPSCVKQILASSPDGTDYFFF